MRKLNTFLAVQVSGNNLDLLLRPFLNSPNNGAQLNVEHLYRDGMRALIQNENLIGALI